MATFHQFCSSQKIMLLFKYRVPKIEQLKLVTLIHLATGTLLSRNDGDESSIARLYQLHRRKIAFECEKETLKHNLCSIDRSVEVNETKERNTNTIIDIQYRAESYDKR